MNTAQNAQRLNQQVQQRILLMDGAMGSMIQRYGLQEEDYQGERFAEHSHPLKGNNDLLNITQPQVIEEIHRRYLEAGADIIETNTFNANTISQEDYQLASLAYDLNVAGAQVARRAADAMTAQTPDKPRFVAGALGPTNRTASLSPDVNDPGARNVTFKTLVNAYREAAEGLVDGGADLLLVETVFDTLNAKAALYAIAELQETRNQQFPVMISGTITDMAGRNLSGQTVEAFWYSTRHIQPFSMGLNCAFGPDLMRPYIQSLSPLVDTNLCAYPNAGLPNELGQYDLSPDAMAEELAGWMEEGLVNLVGGCCGSTPDHIAAIAQTAQKYAPRTIPQPEKRLRLSGLEPFVL